MIEATTEANFQNIFQRETLDTVIESLELAQTYSAFGERRTKIPTGYLMAKLVEQRLMPPTDSFMQGVLRERTLVNYYHEHSQNCDAVIARWNGERE